MSVMGLTEPSGGAIRFEGQPLHEQLRRDEDQILGLEARHHRHHRVAGDPGPHHLVREQVVDRIGGEAGRAGPSSRNTNGISASTTHIIR